jgi:predicted nucleic acid-binding protein
VAIEGWLVDSSVAARSTESSIRFQLGEIESSLYLCEVGELEQLYAARSQRDYEALKFVIHRSFSVLPSPPDLLNKALELQRDLAHHHGMWHRSALPDLLMASTALHYGLGIVHVGGDFTRIAEVRALRTHELH